MVPCRWKIFGEPGDFIVEAPLIISRSIWTVYQASSFGLISLSKRGINVIKTELKSACLPVQMLTKNSPINLSIISPLKEGSLKFRSHHSGISPESHSRLNVTSTIAYAIIATLSLLEAAVGL